MFSKFWRWYGGQLKVRPIITKSLTAFVMVTIGDMNSQLIEKCRKYLFILVVFKLNKSEPKGFNLKRTLRFASLALFLTAPYFHFYTVHFLPKFFPINNFGSLVIRVLFDSIVCSPLMNLFIHTMIPFLEGKGFEEIKVRIKGRFWPTQLSAWSYWPWMQMINFWFIPIPFQVLYLNFAALIWYMIFSYMLFSYQPSLK